MADFEVNGIAYKSTKLPGMPAVRLLAKLGSLATGENIALALSNMPEEKLDAIVGACLNACERQMPGGKGWAKIWNKPAAQPMFDDIGLMEIGQIVTQVVNENFADFLPGSGLFSSVGRQL